LREIMTQALSRNSHSGHYRWCVFAIEAMQPPQSVRQLDMEAVSINRRNAYDKSLTRSRNGPKKDRRPERSDAQFHRKRDGITLCGEA